MQWERLGDELVVLDSENGVVHRIPVEAAESVETQLVLGETSRRRVLALLAAGSIGGVTSMVLPTVAAASSGGSGTTDPDPLAPGAPTNLVASSATSTSITLTWTGVDGADSYEVWYRAGTSGAFSLLAAGIAGASHVATGLTNNTAYDFTVRAIKSGLASVDSSVLAASTTNVTSMSTPGAPTVTLDGSDPTALSVSWAAVSGATSYELWRAVGDGTSMSKILDPASSPVTQSGLSVNTRYRYAVKARNADITSELSGEGSLLTPPASPSAPTFGTVSATSIQVQWSAVTGAAGSGTGGYRVKYGTSSGSITTNGGTTYGTSLTVTGLDPETTYWFTVEAGSESGWSEVSTSASQATLQYASGGVETLYTLGGVTYRVHTFNSSGTFTLNAPRTVDHLIVGGGGGGGGGGINDGSQGSGGFGGGGGGGGAGQVVSGSASRAAGTYSVVVGEGGVGGKPGTVTWWGGRIGARGDSSSAFSVTATRGTGGNGGGAPFDNTTEYPNGEGYESSLIWMGSGGGGGRSGSLLAGGDVPYLTLSGRVGGQGASTTSAGSFYNYGVVAGSSNSISGTSIRYGDGGGGGGERNSGVTGFWSATPGSGGGGGEGAKAGTAGQDGIVILRYPI